MTQPETELLTETERNAMALTAQLANSLPLIVGNGPTRTADINEAVFHIHGIQHMILAQAAARAYPREYRLLGEVIK